MLDHECVPLLIDDLQLWFVEWTTLVNTSGTTFIDSIVNETPERRQYLIACTSRIIDRLGARAARGRGVFLRPNQTIPAGRNLGPHAYEAEIALLQRQYVPPGSRHDNDHAQITEIEVPPTTHELASTSAPFLPANIPNSPSPAPSGSMSKQIDTHFRLLREELVAPIRTAAQLVLTDWQDLKARKGNNELRRMISAGGGKYRGSDQVNVNVYSDVTFLQASVNKVSSRLCSLSISES